MFTPRYDVIHSLPTEDSQVVRAVAHKRRLLPLIFACRIEARCRAELCRGGKKGGSVAGAALALLGIKRSIGRHWR
ncbi:hypothetical protein MPL3365_110021 [Mesorhizobium plurifarium]|uniref:Uncharacterized protein n=1 Tax=Mesorhizobium plurifarium TaxID=69974 RepID=A0A090G0Z7_MESPL|nr:hypothetical protein MPL3365_110021 [Mesorhizobium plurifarium]